MLIQLKQLQHLSVETVSGTKLGKIHDIVFELDGQLIAQYMVKSSVIARDMYVISRDQVVRFEQDKLIVDDAMKPVPVASHPAKKQAPPNPAVAMRGE
ncbi:MAG TPA: PRC-barrel domain-containing protein [Candidatus Kapabacteria bacterium]|nr:PRC-barrel domain-containing protein [Candidatus Kapabacteria bacterium]